MVRFENEPEGQEIPARYQLPLAWSGFIRYLLTRGVESRLLGNRNGALKSPTKKRDDDN